MILKLFLSAILFCVYTLKVTALTTLNEPITRPEIFQLTDNNVAVFDITLPREDFLLLLDKADYMGITPPITLLKEEFKILRETFRQYLFSMFYYNFTELFPGYDFRNDLFGIYVGPDGYPDVDRMIRNLDFNVEHYKDFDFVFGNLNKHILENGKYNYTDISLKILELSELYNSQVPIDELYTKYLNLTHLTANNQNQEYYTEDNFLTNHNEFPVRRPPVQYAVQQPQGPSPYRQSPYRQSQRYGQPQNDGIFWAVRYFFNKRSEEPTADDPNSNEFKSKNGKLAVEVAGNVKTFEKVTLSLSGEYSRLLVKPNFSLKIKDEGVDLLGRKHFKLRSDFTEPTFLRSKLTSDIHRAMGLTSIFANYAVLNINGEYMGLFVLTDTYKESWIEKVYGEEDPKHLYKCKGGAYIRSDTVDKCVNEDEDIDPLLDEEWIQFLETVDKAESAEDIEDIFEVEDFIYEMAIEYLLGAWDHIQLGHNFYLYKQPNGKWKYLTYDHDHSFGINLDRIYIGIFYLDLPERLLKLNRDYPNYTFEEWTQDYHIIDILILKNPERFKNAIKDIVTTVFNPAVLFPHIDALKKFIKPYVQMDYSPNMYGYYPGRINPSAYNAYTYAHWDANSEYTTVGTLQYNTYGIKYWILAKYRFVCKTYEIECDPVYLDENYTFPINKNIEFKGYRYQFGVSSLPI